MSDHRRRLEKDLRANAERWEPQLSDPWHGVKERLSGEQETGAGSAGEQRVGELAESAPSGRAWFPRLVPDTPIGYALAILSVLIIGMGAYAASGALRDLILYGQPGPGAAGTGETTDLGQAGGGSEAAHNLFRSLLPGGGGEEVSQTQTAGGAKVTLWWAYADAESVVISYTVEDLRGERRAGGHPAELHPAAVQDGPNAQVLPERRVRLTDENGTEFSMVGGQGAISPGPNNIVEGPKENSAVFEAQGKIEPGQSHRFSLEIPLEEWALIPMVQETVPKPEPVGEAFAFDFEIPVRPAPTTEVNETAAANGITLTLERVTNAPGKPEAVICVEPPDKARAWTPTGGDLASGATRPVEGSGQCLEMPLDDPVGSGRSSLTVSQLEGNVRSCPLSNEEGCAKQEDTIRGPWTFDFEVPTP